MRRHALGIIGIVMVITGIVILLRAGSAANMTMYASICMRAGCILCAIWLAFPQVTALLRKCPPWMVGLIFAAAVAAIVTKSFAIIIPMIAGLLFLHFIGWLFKPLPPSRQQGRSSKKSSESTGKRG